MIRRLLNPRFFEAKKGRLRPFPTIIYSIRSSRSRGPAPEPPQPPDPGKHHHPGPLRRRACRRRQRSPGHAGNKGDQDQTAHQPQGFKIFKIRCRHQVQYICFLNKPSLATVSDKAAAADKEHDLLGICRIASLGPAIRMARGKRLSTWESGG